ncbi:MAG: hypothetical protein H0W12_05350 [Chitinophagaceae bacterium]|nr:hypothetical protein [Chitinophagaceae bacterium]
MKNIFLVIICGSFVLFSCNNTPDSKTGAPVKNSYELTKEDLLNKEKKTPQDFLKVTGSDKRNLLGQTVVRGIVTNKASVCSYKDINVKMDFYSKTGTLLETDNETVYEVFSPGTSKNFKTKYFAPKGTDSVALQVITAKIQE